MTYSKFKKELVLALQPRLSDDHEIQIDTIHKNNGIDLDGLIIKDPSTNIFPTIYLDEYYKDLEAGVDLSKIVNRILEVYDNHKIGENIDVAILGDFEKIKSKIMFKLVNKDKNRALIEKSPWRPFLDLAIVYQIWFENSPSCNGSVTINDTHTKTWQVDEETLYAHAKENFSRQFAPTFTSLPDFFNEIAGEVIIDLEAADKYLYILTNKSKFYGATCMLDKEAIKSFSDRFGTNVFILPSSIHEVLLLSDDGHTRLEDLSHLVTEVNKDQVDPLEYLCDHAYLYLRDEDKIVY